VTRLFHTKEDVVLTLDREQALVLFDLLQRLTEDEEARLLPLLNSSAEFAVLCAMNNQLEKTLAEPFSEHYEELLKKARAQIIRLTGRYEGIEEK
jgi:hypothetical protein